MNYIFIYPYSTLFYSLIMIISLFFAFIAQKSKTTKMQRIFVALVILSLALPAGLRDSSVGKDTWAYIRAFQSASAGYQGELFYTYYENGFSLLIKILIMILKEPYYVNLFISILTNILIIKTLWTFRNNLSFSFSIFLYYTLYYFETYNILRQYLAIAIIFFGTKFLLDKKYVIFLAFVLLASSIHRSAIIGILYIPIDILIKKKLLYRHKILILFFILSFAFFHNYVLDAIGLKSVFNKYITYYIHKSGINVNLGFFFVVRLAIIFFSLYVLRKKGFIDYEFSKFIILLNLLGTILTMSGYIYTFTGRIGTYFLFNEIIFWSMLIKIKDKPLALLLKIVFVMLNLFILFSNLNGSTQGQMPYKIFLR